MSFFRDMLGPLAPAKKKPVPRLPIPARNYHAANVGRLFADFAGSSASADSELLNSLEKMRMRARDLERNEPYVRRFFELMKVNVNGPHGQRLQVKARNNIGDGLDTFGNNAVETAWQEFCAHGNCTADGRMSMKALSDLVLVGALRDGEAFLQVVKGSQFPHGIAFHPFEPDMVDERKNIRLQNGNRVRMGVELDKYNRPVAFWVKDNHPGDYQVTTSTLGKERRIPAEEIVHVKYTRRANQTRGETALAPVITTIKMLNGHREAELVASRIAAAKMGFFTSRTGEDLPVDTEEGENGMPEINAEPGTFHQLPEGVNFTAFDPTHPSTAFADFQKNIIRAVAMGMGVSYESLSGDLEGVSYSSIRQGSISERDFYEMMQGWIAEQFLFPIYRIWLEHALDFGIIGGNIPARRFGKFYSASTFRGRGWQWVDPEKEIRAHKEAMHLGVESMTGVATAQGRDLEDVFAQISRDKELANQYNITLDFEPFGAPAGQKPDENNAPLEN